MTLRVTALKADAERPTRHSHAERGNDHGPGYRVYFKRVGEVVYLLLIGGDKSTQKRDIERAKEIADEFEKKE